MPLFEYRCKKCGYVNEFLESAASRKAHRCEKCDSTRLERIFSAFSVGSGEGSGSSQSSSCPTGTCPLP
jgi:putative FmdB family regulatory protein